MNEKQLENLSKTISYALRHNPSQFGIVLDEEGWTSVPQLLIGLKKESRKWSDVSRKDIEDIIEIESKQSKKRYQLEGDRIRAYYGHSAQDIKKTPIEPPEILYHGTTPDALISIRQSGLKKMKRKHVHLSADTETATTVALRRTNKPVILIVRAKEAYLNGIEFYKENNGIYLSQPIPFKFIDEQ